MEDFVTWTHTSAIRKHVMDYNEMVSYLIDMNYCASGQTITVHAVLLEFHA